MSNITDELYQENWPDGKSEQLEDGVVDAGCEYPGCLVKDQYSNSELDDWTEVRRLDKLPRQEESPSLWRGVK
jgi:hypothetical protein